MPRKNNKPAAKPFAVNVLTITAITLACLMIGAYAVYEMVVGEGGKESAPLPVPHAPPVSETSMLGTFDYNGTLTRLDGTEIKMSTFKGRVVFLNFWASWCPPCIVELPNIQRLHGTMAGNDGIAFLMVSTENAKTIRGFMDQRNYDFPAYIAKNKLLNDLRVTAYPATFILNRSGQIVFKHMGAAKWDDPAFIKYLNDLTRDPS